MALGPTHGGYIFFLTPVVRTDVEFSAAAYVAQETDVTFSAHAFIARYATTAFRNARRGYRVLVEIDWPSGGARYADHSVALTKQSDGSKVGYDGRLVSIGAITLGTNGRKDSCDLALSNTPSLTTIEELWTAANPPEGSEVRIYFWFPDDPYEFRVEIMRGVIDQVTGVDEERVELSILSTEEEDARLLGTVVDLVEWPDAPEASVGKMEPFVFGTVEQFEGVPVTEVGKSTLAATALAADTSLILDDVSRFADAGTLIIGEEEWAWTTRTVATNTLNGATARVKDYVQGTEVREKTSLVVLVASHEVDSIDAVYGVVGERLALLASSLYTVDLVGPSKVTFADGWPILDVPAGGSQFVQFQFDAAGSGNTATNPTFACGEHVDWTEKNYATVAGSGNKLVVDQTTDVVSLGTILKAWAMVEYDGSKIVPAYQGGATIVWKLKHSTTDLGTLTEKGNLPVDLKNRAGALGITRAYDDTNEIDNPSHVHSSASGPRTITIFCDTAVVVAPSFPNVGVIADGNFSNPGTASGLNIQVQAYIQRTLEDLGTPTSMIGKIDSDMVSSGPKAYITANGGDSTTVTLPTTRIAVSTGSRPVTTWAQVAAATIQIDPAAPLNAGDIIYEMWFEVTYTPYDTAAGTQNSSLDVPDPITHTVAFLGDVTSLAAGDWSWFDTRSITVEHISGTVVTALRVVRVSFIIEYAPIRQAPAERILVDVTGLVTDGAATDILRALISRADMLDRGTSGYNDGDLTTAQARLDVAAASVETLLPNGTASNTLSLQGGATLHAVTSDSDDATYAYYASDVGDTKTGTVNLASYTLTGSEKVLFVELRATLEGTGNGVEITVELLHGVTAVATITVAPPTGTPIEYSAVWASGELTQAEIDALTVRMTVQAGDGIITGQGQIDGIEVKLTLSGGGVHRLDFAITERESGDEIISEVCRQSRLRYWYEEGALCVKYMEDPSDIAAPAVTVRRSDMPESDESYLKRDRTAWREIVNDISASFRYDYREARMVGSVRGTLPTVLPRDSAEDVEYPMIRDEASARGIMYGALLRRYVGRYGISFSTYLVFLDVRRSDTIGVVTGRVSLEKIEVEEIVIDPESDEIRFSGRSYD